MPLTSGGFAFMWSGVKATFGVNKGKVCFEVKVSKHLDAEHLPAEEDKHVMRIGFSVDGASTQLGEGSF